MEEVRRYAETGSRYRKRVYIAYTEQEAIDKGIQYVPWREVEYTGQYVLTDDGYVAEALKVETMPGGKKFLRTCFARAMLPSNQPLNFTGWWNRIKEANERALTKSGALRRMVQLYVAMMQTGTVDYNELGKIYKPTQRIPAARVKMILKKESIQKMVREELRKVYSDEGLSESVIVKTWMEAVEIAKRRNSAMALSALISTAARWFDMEPKQEKTTGALGAADGDGNKFLGMFTKLLNEGSNGNNSDSRVPDSKDEGNADKADSEMRVRADIHVLPDAAD